MPATTLKPRRRTLPPPSAARPSAADRVRALVGDPIPSETLAFFFEKLAVLLHAGHSVDAALVEAAPPHGELRCICEAAAPRLQDGEALHRALAPWKTRLPPIVLPVLEVGELSGSLEGAAHRLAAAFGQAASFERRYHNAAYSPWLVIVGLTAYVTLHRITQPPVEVMLSGLGLLAYLSVGYVALRVAARWLFRWEPLRVAVDTVRLALPYVGTVTRDLAAARWARSYATLWNAGVPMGTAVEVSARTALNGSYERALRRAVGDVQQGRPLSDSLASTQLLPRYLLEIVHTGETTGRVSATLELLAEQLEIEAAQKAQQTMMTVVVIGDMLLILALAAGAM